MRFNLDRLLEIGAIHGIGMGGGVGHDGRGGTAGSAGNERGDKDNDKDNDMRETLERTGYVDARDDPAKMPEDKKERLEHNRDIHQSVTGTIPDSLRTQIDDYNSNNSFYNALNIFSSILGVANPLAGMASSGVIDHYANREQQPGETSAQYAGRTSTSSNMFGGLADIGLSVAGGLLGAPRGAVEIGKIGKDAYGRSSQIAGGTPSQSPRTGDNDSNLSGRNVGNPSIASAPIIPETPEVTQPVKQPFSVGKLDRDRYGLLSALR